MARSIGMHTIAYWGRRWQTSPNYVILRWLFLVFIVAFKKCISAGHIMCEIIGRRLLTDRFLLIDTLFQLKIYLN